MTSGSSISCVNCNLTNNFALSSGIISVNEDGYFSFSKSRVWNNLAYSVTFTEISEVSSMNNISNSTFMTNKLLTL